MRLLRSVSLSKYSTAPTLISTLSWIPELSSLLNLSINPKLAQTKMEAKIMPKLNILFWVLKALRIIKIINTISENLEYVKKHPKIARLEMYGK